MEKLATLVLEALYATVCLAKTAMILWCVGLPFTQECKLLNLSEDVFVSLRLLLLCKL